MAVPGAIGLVHPALSTRATGGADAEPASTSRRGTTEARASD